MKKLGAVLLVAWLGAGITAIYLWRQLEALRSEHAALHARVVTLEARKPIAAAIAPQVPPVETAAAPVATSSSPAVEQPVANPEDGDFRRGMMRATMNQLYPDLGQELGLTSDQLEKFEDLLNRFSSRGPTGQTEVAKFLGDKYPQWQAYQDSLPGRRQVSQLRGQLAASGSTLPEAQAQPLVAALNAELQRMDQEARQLPPHSIKSIEETRKQVLQRQADMGPRLVKAATPYLDVQQLDSYRRLLDQQLSMGRMMMDVMDTAQTPAAPHN